MRRTASRADHDGDGRCKAECAGAGDDEDGDGDGEGELEGGACHEPDAARQEGERDDHGDKDGRHAVGKACDRCLGPARIVHETDQLADGCVLADTRRGEADRALHVERARGNRGALRLRYGHGFARHGGLIDARCALRDRAVDGDAGAGADDDGIAEGEGCGGDGHFPSVAQDDRLRRSQLHERLECPRSLPLGACFEVFSDRDERDDHARRLEVEVRAVLRREGEITVPEPPAHAEHGEHAEERGRHRTDADERVHIRRAVQETAEPVDIVCAVHIHDGQDEHELRERERQRVLRAPEHIGKAGGIGDAPVCEHMAHRNVHGRQEEEDRHREA